MYDFSLSGQFNAPVDKLFSAFYEPALLQQWFAPGQLMVGQAMSSFQPEGKYRIVMQEPDGSQHIVVGTYLEIVENQRLVFSWRWEGSEQTTTVELSFRPIDSDTSELTLYHHGFTEQQDAEDHQHGWLGCLEKLSVITLADQISEQTA